jgi:hypothetical protein
VILLRPLSSSKNAIRSPRHYEKKKASAVNETYTKPLKTRNNAYNNVAVDTMMAYLFTAYGNIDEESCTVNEKKFIEPWDGSSPFENIIEQPYTSPQILSKIYTLVYDTGLYFDACKKWKELPAANKTYDQFKLHFLKAQKTHRNQQHTMKQSNYGLSVTRMEEMAEKFAGYVAVDRAEKDMDRNHVFQTLNNLETKHYKEMAEIKALMLKMGQQGPQTVTVAPPAAARTRTTPVDNGSYCWSHGYLVHSQHTSATCRNKNEGHIDAAALTMSAEASAENQPPCDVVGRLM